MRKELLRLPQQLVASHYLAASLLYLIFTAAACVLLALPGVTFAVVAGALFGPWMGSLYCLLGTTLGAVLSFLVGRYFLRDTLRPLVMKNKYLRNALFSERKESALTLLMITRLLPVFPFNLQNFAYGITDIGIIRYTWATFVFMIPGVLFFTLTTAGLLGEGDGRLFWAAVGSVAVFIGIGLWAKRIYRKRFPENGRGASV